MREKRGEKGLCLFNEYNLEGQAKAIGVIPLFLSTGRTYLRDTNAADLFPQGCSSFFDSV